MKTNGVYRGLKKLDELVFKLNKFAVGKKGSYYYKILKDWTVIVGEELSNQIIPVKISTSKTSKLKNKSLENILYIAANNSATAAELIYKLEVIKEQINLYLGEDYVQHIRVNQAVFTVNQKEIIEENFILNNEEIEKLEYLISGYNFDDSIKNTLMEFAKALICKGRRP